VTKEVESIKNEFTKEQEILKADLQRILSNEVSYRNEERNALMQFHSTISEWMYSILEVNYGNFNKANIESLIATRNNISSYYAKAGIANSKVQLLVVDQKLLEQSHGLYSVALSFHHWSSIEFFNIQMNLEKQKGLTNRVQMIINQIGRTKEQEQEIIKAEEQLLNEAKELFKHYMDNRNEEYVKVHQVELEFSKLVKDYLKQ